MPAQSQELPDGFGCWKAANLQPILDSPSAVVSLMCVVSTLYGCPGL